MVFAGLRFIVDKYQLLLRVRGTYASRIQVQRVCCERDTDNYPRQAPYELFVPQRYLSSTKKDLVPLGMTG